MRKISFLALIIFTGLASVSAHGQAQILYVDDDAPLGGDGLTWNSAFTFLADALYSASSHSNITEIHVAQGIYKPDRDESSTMTPGDRIATFQMRNALTLSGGYAGYGAVDPDARDINAHETILSGDLESDDIPQYFMFCEENSHHVVTADGTDETAVLDGFIIQSGNTDGAAIVNRNYSPAAF